MDSITQILVGGEGNCRYYLLPHNKYTVGAVGRRFGRGSASIYLNFFAINGKRRIKQGETEKRKETIAFGSVNKASYPWMEKKGNEGKGRLDELINKS